MINYIDRMDQYRTLIGDLLIRYLAAYETGLTNRDLNFNTNQHGKPYLMNNEHFHFNISHSSEYVVCIISNQEVGIDIEEVKPLDMPSFNRLFTKDEVNYMRNSSNHLKGFYDIWTAKESFLKMIGKGITVPLSSFSITKIPEIHLFRVAQNYIEVDAFVKSYEVDKNYVVGACSTFNQFPNEISEMSFSNLVSVLRLLEEARGISTKIN